MQSTFTRLYASGGWTLRQDDEVSRSGLGSNVEQTAALRAELPQLLADLGIRSMLDVPCGDFFWMGRIDLGVDRYIGADIVTELIEENAVQFGRADREFRVLDLSQDDLPRVDLVFSRDCLVHLSNDDAMRCLDNIKRSGSTYLAATTFTERDHNDDIVTGRWRTLNLCVEPFSLPAPERLLNERCTEVYRFAEDGREREERFTDKSIGVWRIADL